jgi:hypothetical protein
MQASVCLCSLRVACSCGPSSQLFGAPLPDCETLPFQALSDSKHACVCCHRCPSAGGSLKQRDLQVADPLFGEGAGLRRRRLSAAGGGGGGLGGKLAPTDHTLVAPEEE